MAVPLAQTWAVTRHVLWHKLRRTRRYAVVLMLEPLLRCNLACPGCGKIQHPPDVLRRQLTPDQCFEAARQCGAPIVSIAGGEPLLHPRIVEIVEGLIARRKFVYLCTNAVKLETALDQFQPNRRLTLSVHLDGPQDLHDEAVGRTGVFDLAIRAIRAALARGFRVTTNMTLFHGADVDRLRRHFDQVMQLGVEGMMISPGYAYAQAAHQDGFLSRKSTRELFQRLLEPRHSTWRFHQTPLFLEFLQGRYDLQCTPWGNPTYNVFGWQRPCYLLNEGHAESFTQLLETTEWSRYGQAGGHPACRDCMVHCGYEPSALDATLGTPGGLLATLRSLCTRVKIRPSASGCGGAEEPPPPCLLGGALTEQLHSKNATTVPARWGAD